MRLSESYKAQRILNELRDRDIRRRHLDRLMSQGHVDAYRLTDAQIADKILRTNQINLGKNLNDRDVSTFAKLTGNTTDGARIMLETDARYNTATFVRANNHANKNKASAALIKELREAGHSPKPAFIKISSGQDGFFKPSLEDFRNEETKDSVISILNSGFATIDRAGCLVDTRQNLPSGAVNLGFNKRYVPDVDIAVIISCAGLGTSTCDQRTYSSVLRSNSWFYNQLCSCTHGAFLQWKTKIDKNLKIKENYAKKHSIDKDVPHGAQAASQFLRAAMLKPHRTMSASDLANATFKPVDADPIIGYLNGEIIHTYIDRLVIDIISRRMRG